MVIPSETALINILTWIVRRIAVEKGIISVIMLYQDFKILIFNHSIFKSFADLLYQLKKAYYWKWLTGKGFSAAWIAVSQKFKKHYCSAQVIVLFHFYIQFNDFFCFQVRQDNLRQFQFLIKVLIFKLLLFKKFLYCIEIIPWIKRIKSSSFMNAIGLSRIQRKRFTRLWL